MSFVKSFLRIIRFIIFALLLLVVVIFCADNRQSVVLNLNPLPYEIEVRLFLIIIFFFLLGLFCGFFSNIIGLLKAKFHNLKNNWRIKKLNKRILVGQNPKQDLTR